MADDPNPRNRKVAFEICKYASGPWKDRWVVRKTTTEDVAATLTEGDALALKRVLEKGEGR